MPDIALDVKPEVDSSLTSNATPEKVVETAPLSTDEGLTKVINDTFKKSESSPEKKDEKTEAKVEKTEPEVKPTDIPPEKQEEKKVETEDKGPIPYERFAEVNKAKVAYESQVAEMQPMVNSYQTIVNHCNQYDITPQDFSYWMDIAALAKTDPTKAMKMLEPALSQLKSFVGEVLPKDLQSAVDAGEMTRDWAMKLAASQAQQTFNAQRSQQVQQQAVQTQQRAFQQTLVQGLDAWSKNKAEKNPDFAPKDDANAPDGLYELFINKLNVVARTAKINSVEDLVSTAENVLKSVESSIGRYRTPVKPTVNVRTQNTVTNKPTPIKSVDDAIAAAAAKHGIVMSK